jgi:L-ascorbate oxidase
MRPDCKLGAALGLALLAASVAGQSVTSYNFHVTVGSAAPDCFQKDVLLVNGELNPTIRATVGDILELNVFNELPADWPDTTDGISIHFHGFSQRGSPWYDGVGYHTQCPIPAGANFTYRTKVSAAGTYLWHGHSGSERVDGFYGPLIVATAGPDPLADLYDEEIVLLLSDWYHSTGADLEMPLNRPFYPSFATNTSGAWIWADNPQSVLINGHGFFEDCSLGPAGNMVPIPCNVTTKAVPAGRSTQNPTTSEGNPGCAHENVTVTSGKTYRLRVINGGMLTYLTMQIQGHNMTIIAADGVPTDPLTVTSLDVNIGQRYDVLLTADAPPGNYWITVQPQYRPGSPSGTIQAEFPTTKLKFSI